MTACSACVHLLTIGPLLHEKQCRLAPLMHFDAYTGTSKQVGFRPITEVNFGKCPNFEAKPDKQEGGYDSAE